jgi:hypothetical protein
MVQTQFLIPLHQQQAVAAVGMLLRLMAKMAAQVVVALHKAAAQLVALVQPIKVLQVVLDKVAAIFAVVQAVAQLQ